ncbi:ABC transporter permease [Paenibacillus piri]|nr:ABC transporter permease [Paenibacillus piri]
MYSLYANVMNETEKMWKRRRTIVFLMLTLLIPVLSAVMLSSVQNAGVFGGLGGSLPMLMLSLFTVSLLPLFLFITAADSFSGEEAARTMKLILVRPITRAKAFSSKVLAMAFYIGVQLATLWLVSVLAGWFAPGGGMTGSLADSIKAYAAAFVPMFAIGLIAAFIAQCFGSSSGAMALTICIYAAAKVLPFFFPFLSVWSVFSYTNWYVLWIGKAASVSKLFNTFVLLFSYSIMAYTGGWLLFERKQL